MHVDGSRATYLGVAALMSTEMGATGFGCLMKFRYYMGGTGSFQSEEVHSGIMAVEVGVIRVDLSRISK